MKFDISILFENLLREIKFEYNLTRITGTVHEDQFMFMIISHSVLLRMRNFSDKICRENQNTHFMLNNFFPRKSYLFWDNIEEYGRVGQATDDNITRRMPSAFWIIKATDTHSEYVLLIVFCGKNGYANATLSRYMFTACLAYKCILNFILWYSLHVFSRDTCKISAFREPVFAQSLSSFKNESRKKHYRVTATNVDQNWSA
jgi:hypothetical protein